MTRRHVGIVILLGLVITGAVAFTLSALRPPPRPDVFGDLPEPYRQIYRTVDTMHGDILCADKRDRTNIVEIRLLAARGITRERLASLRPLTTLRSLNLSGSDVNDDDLEGLSEVASLE